LQRADPAAQVALRYLVEHHVPLATTANTGVLLAIGAFLVFGVVARLLFGPRGRSPGDIAPEGTPIRGVGNGPEFRAPKDEADL
jgi:hypothetical protein